MNKEARACYKFEHATIYVHHDNYPSGAAHYLQNMLDWILEHKHEASPNMTYGDAFLRANIRAELTSCAADHGDLDYVYTIDPDSSLEMTEMSFPNCYTTVEARLYNGGIEDFIAKYREEKE